MLKTLAVLIRPRSIRYDAKERAGHTKCGMAERVGFEPTVELPRRMLSKHVDSATLAPLQGRGSSKRRHLSMGPHERQGERRLLRWIRRGTCRILRIATIFDSIPIPRSYGLTLGYIQRYKSHTTSRVFAIQYTETTAPRRSALVREWRNWQTRET